jgi:hypothetical protein
MKMRVDRALVHLGILNFQLKNVAQVERYLYGQTSKEGKPDCLLIVQLEAIIPGLKGTYSFNVVNPTRIGRFDYQTDIGLFNFAQTASANPGAEAAHTRAYLTRNGMDVSDDFVVARYARVVGTAKRHEIIVFYLESLRSLRVSRADMDDAGSDSDVRQKVFQEVSARAVRSFTIEDWDH